MKKIMFYINAIHDGGAERVMVNLAKYLSENNYDTVLVTSFRDTWEYPLSTTVRRVTLEENEIKQSKIKRNVSRIIKLREVCKKEKPDILISFMAEPNFRAILATRGLHIKTLVSVRNDPKKEYTGIMGHFVGKIILPMADGCVFQTIDAQEWFPKKLQRKSRIIYNAVKEEFYYIKRVPVSGEIVTCGRLVEQKNHILLINAFEKVIKKFPFAILKIYGEGPLHEKIQEYVNKLNLYGKVLVMGATDDVGKVLQRADLFVLSSDYEGMPNALMEAMAAGVPSIATDCPCGGPRELFGMDASKKLIPCNDVRKLAIAIEEALSNNESGEIEKKHAEAFRPERVNTTWKNYIMEIIERGDGR